HLHEHSRRRLDAEDPLEVLLGSLAEARERVLHRVETALEALDDAVKYRLTNVLEHPREGYDKGRNRVSDEENNRLNQGDDKLREDLGRLGDDTDEHIDDSSDDPTRIVGDALISLMTPNSTPLIRFTIIRGISTTRFLMPEKNCRAVRTKKSGRFSRNVTIPSWIDLRNLRTI